MNTSEVFIEESKVQAFIRLLRPKQWTKNLLIFAALLFSINQINIENVYYASLGFVLFCTVSSCVYIFNDYIDREQDSHHPEKRHRPLASGALDPAFAIVAGAVLLFLSLAIALALNPMFFLILTVYFCLNVSYSVRLKYIVIVDIMTIAVGFVLRAVAGGVIIDVTLTPWFLICTLLLALFLAIGKRRHEVDLMQQNRSSSRKVLEYYSLEFLDQLSGIVTTSVVMSYALYTFTSGRTLYMMITIPLVLYGIFRYLYLIHVEKKGGSPEKVLLEDKPIFNTVVIYVISVAVILYCL